jgi:hypothetical protein
VTLDRSTVTVEENKMLEDEQSKMLANVV